MCSVPSRRTPVPPFRQDIRWHQAQDTHLRLAPDPRAVLMHPSRLRPRRCAGRRHFRFRHVRWPESCSGWTSRASARRCCRRLWIWHLCLWAMIGDAPQSLVRLQARQESQTDRGLRGRACWQIWLRGCCAFGTPPSVCVSAARHPLPHRPLWLRCRRQWVYGRCPRQNPGDLECRGCLFYNHRSWIPSLMWLPIFRAAFQSPSSQMSRFSWFCLTLRHLQREWHHRRAGAFRSKLSYPHQGARWLQTCVCGLFHRLM